MSKYFKNINKKLNLVYHPTVRKDIIDAVREAFAIHEHNDDLTTRKVGDNRIFHFQEYLESRYSKVFLTST